MELLGWLGVLQGVQGVRYAALNVGQHHSLKTLHDDWSEFYWYIIRQVGGLFLGRGTMVVVFKQKGTVLNVMKHCSS